MFQVKTLLTSYLANLNDVTHDPFATRVWEQELETFLMEETSIGDMENKFFQFRDIHKIKRHIKGLLDAIESQATKKSD